MSNRPFTSWLSEYFERKIGETMNVVTVRNGISFNVFESFVDDIHFKDEAWIMEISFENKNQVASQMYTIEKIVMNELYNEAGIMNCSIVSQPAEDDRKIYTYRAIIRVSYYIEEDGW